MERDLFKIIDLDIWSSIYDPHHNDEVIAKISDHNHLIDLLLEKIWNLLSQDMSGSPINNIVLPRIKYDELIKHGLTPEDSQYCFDSCLI